LCRSRCLLDDGSLARFKSGGSASARKAAMVFSPRVSLCAA
jgi:hypothetical protein